MKTIFAALSAALLLAGCVSLMQLGLRQPQLCLGLVALGGGIAWVNHQQQVALLHLLVIFDA